MDVNPWVVTQDSEVELLTQTARLCKELEMIRLEVEFFEPRMDTKKHE
jgi:hypothetical protein